VVVGDELGLEDVCARRDRDVLRMSSFVSSTIVAPTRLTTTCTDVPWITSFGAGETMLTLAGVEGRPDGT